MPKISKKGQFMPASPIRKLVPYSDEAKSRGIHVYHLNIGQPDIATTPYALEAVKNYDEKSSNIPIRQVLFHIERNFANIMTD